jgi:hypothetical protein
MVEEIEAFLVRSGWSPREVALVRHDLPRWERHVRRRGITVVPGPQAYWSEEEDRSHSELFLLMMQAGHGVDPWTEHRQRDVTNVRPSNPAVKP